MNIELGNTYRDSITGFTGVAIGHADYITGCAQTLLQPRSVEAVSKRPDSEWFDDQRLVLDHTVAPLRLDNGNNPGSDKPAPRI